MVQWATGYVVSHGTNLHYYRSGGSGSALEDVWAGMDLDTKIEANSFALLHRQMI
jgi:hypothetical protein